MSRPQRWIRFAAVAVVCATGAYYSYYAWQAYRQPPLLQPGPVAQSPPFAIEPAVVPPTHYQIDSNPTVTLPDLDASDDAVVTELEKLIGRKALLAFLYSDGMIRRFVATVDNLPRKRAPSRMMPVKPIRGAFRAIIVPNGLAIDPANSARYERAVDLFETVDAARLIDLYFLFYPLCQRAYRELGYPTGYFNDRLIEALDDMLAAPEPDKSVELVQPKVLYEYADPELEALSAGEKIMIRMGSANEVRVKGVLRAIRSELVRRAPAK